MEAYYQAPSLGGGTGVSALLTGNKARTDPQVAYPAAKQKAKAAAAVSCAGYEEWKKAKCLKVYTKTGTIFFITWDRDDEGSRDPLSPGSAASRRHVIYYLFVLVFGAPKKEDWAAPNFHLRLSLPRVIMDMLNIPATSKAAVITTTEAISDAHKAKKEYDPSAAIKAGCGAKVQIEDYTPQADGPPPDLRPVDAKGGVAPHGAVLDGHGRLHQRAHRGGHLGVEASVRLDYRGQGLHRPGRELPNRPPRAEETRRGGA
jgi:hypothetical protein